MPEFADVLMFWQHRRSIAREKWIRSHSVFRLHLRSHLKAVQTSADAPAERKILMASRSIRKLISLAVAIILIMTTISIAAADQPEDETLNLKLNDIMAECEKNASTETEKAL